MGLWWGAGGGGGAAWTPVQLQYDVDVRVVVHRRGAAAARAYGVRFAIDFVTKKRAGFTGRSNLEIETQPWVGRGLVFARPQTVWSYAAKTRIKIEMDRARARDALARDT